MTCCLKKTMPKSAAQRFDEYLAESRETSNAVNDFMNSSFEKNKNYAHAAGTLSMIVQDLIRELSRDKRLQYRDRLAKLAEQQKQEHLINILKQSN
jgi:hypothetical protein